ncbi:MAG TPA: ABC transporter ATP-binding protein [Solirubrobacteraceae bacterium]|jgi:peptide/nickel transport system ATP-binding protein/oligopeptide transport system ATP-binding protein|nr:ABC transporter ATP-binding protein [Solirubrobacteraceae bacterium]
MSAPLIEVRDLVKHFPAGRGIGRRGAGVVHAVDGLTFDVREGETLGIVGESGCGKSTTARLLLGLLRPTSGTVSVGGREISSLSRAQLRPLRRDMQMIFQDPYSSLNPRRTVGASIAEPFAIHGIAPGRAERRRRVQELMESVGLNPEHHNRYPHEFSGGQRQRVGVARAIALGPRIVVADEPVSALDASVQAQILNLLRGLQRDLGLTMVFIAHDLSVVRYMCERIAVMYLGRIVELADVDDLFAHPRHPYTAALLSAVPVLDPQLPARPRRTILGGDPPSATDPPPGCRFHPRCPRFVAGECDVREPLLRPGVSGALVACHHPLTDVSSSSPVSPR